MPSDKKLEKLQKLLEVANEDYATPEDIIKMSEALIAIVVTEKNRLDTLIAESKGQSSKEVADTLAKLDKKEAELTKLINQLKTDGSNALLQASTSLSAEIKRVERKIPSKTDLSGLEADIKALNDGLNSLPTELTMNNEAIRDGLELLQGDERLDKSAIKGLDELIAELKSGKTTQQSFGVRFLRYLADVNIEGITDGQTLVWDTATGTFIPGTAGGGGSGDVVGPASAVDSNFASFNTTTGKIIKDSGSKASDFATAAQGALADSAVQPATLSSYELLSNKATNFSTVNDTLYPTVEAVTEYIASAVVGLLDYRGTYDASTNLYPATGGSGLVGAILKGDFYIVSVAGTLGGTAVTPGDLVIALVDTPAQTSSNWDIISNEVGYTPENAANKVTSISGASTDVQYPSAKLLYDQLLLKADVGGSGITEPEARALIRLYAY